MHRFQQAGDRLWFTTDGQMCGDTPYCAVEDFECLSLVRQLHPRADRPSR